MRGHMGCFSASHEAEVHPILFLLRQQRGAREEGNSVETHF
jgi:hypothetical protein